jgi:Tfp pilus assembly protein PilF
VAEALPLAEQAARLAPDNGMVLDTKGWLLYQTGAIEQAIAVLTLADAKLPEHPIVLYHLGAARLAAGERTAGRRLLVRALALAADFEGAADARRLLATDANR